MEVEPFKYFQKLARCHPVWQNSFE
jgi:hypothetical protein